MEEEIPSIAKVLWATVKTFCNTGYDTLDMKVSCKIIISVEPMLIRYQVQDWNKISISPTLKTNKCKITEPEATKLTKAKAEDNKSGQSKVAI